MSTSSTSNPSVAARAVRSLTDQREALARAVTDALYAEMPELMERYGERGRKKCLQDMRYNLEHLEPAVELGEPGIFARYTLWLNDLLVARGVPTEEVVRCLALTERTVQERLPADEAAQVARCIRAGLSALEPAGA